MAEIMTLNASELPQPAPNSVAINPKASSIASWQSLVAAKQAQLKAAIPQAWVIPPSSLQELSPTLSNNILEANIIRNCNILSEAELSITENYNATALLQKMAKGELTSLEVTLAFSKRAAIAQQLLSCLTETFFDRAQERARFLDDYFKREKKVFGPLHGLPISLKDSFNLEGIQTTLGYVSFLNLPAATTNSALVDILLDLGAVLYVKTNIPQTLMTADSENNIFGRTLNPRNLKLTAGGSSGGEGALVAFRGSILGVGTDIAGSIRIPSLCCGTYGFKPTSNRVPYGGQATPALPGLPGIIPAAGPIAMSLEDISLFLNTILQSNLGSYDSTAASVAWRLLEEKKAKQPSLTIGILPEDPTLPLHPPVRRSLADAVAALTKAGHKLIQLPHQTETSVALAWDLSAKYFSLDPTNTSIQHIKDSGEPMINTVAMGQAAVESFGPRHIYTIEELAALNVQRHNYEQAWHKLWTTNKLDAVIAPGAQHTAPEFDTYGVPGYTVIWNLLDYPACIVPYSKASKTLDPEPYSILPPATGPNYNPSAVDGAPCAVQIVAPRFHDEECLMAAQIIDEVLRHNG